MIDREAIGELAMQLYDTFESTYGDDAKLGDAVLVAEVSNPGGGYDVLIRSTNDRAVTEVGLLTLGLQILRDGLQPLSYDDEGEP